MKRVIAEDGPTLVGADEKKFSAALFYHDRDLQEELTIVEVSRNHMARHPEKAARLRPATRWQSHRARAGHARETADHDHRAHPASREFIVEKRQALGLK